MKTLKEMDVRGKRVIVRCDFNVPLKDGEIRDDNRIVQALPTIKELLNKGARVILMSHLGKINHKDPIKTEADMAKNTLAPVAIRLTELLKQPVSFCPTTRGDELDYFVGTLNNGGVMLVQNTRYEPGEEKNNRELAEVWAKMGDAYVMDAFGSAHRAHVSTYGIPEILKAQGKEVGVGYLVEKEVVNLNKVVEPEERPFIALLGGFKVSDKIKVIDTLLKKCDKILIGGAMAYTFLKAIGYTIGTSPFEEDQLEYAKKCFKEANGKIVLPVDYVVSEEFENPKDIRFTDDANIPDGYMGMDIGEKTRLLYASEIKKSKTLFWNGPMGVFEKEQFTKGTIAVCEAIKELKGAFTVCGGGDSAAAVAQFGYKNAFSHVSTGGGASLEMIENDGKLPGIEIIE